MKSDPERATGFTELWKIRLRTQEEERAQPSEKSRVSLRFPSDRPLKATPEWRRQLSTS